MVIVYCLFTVYWCEIERNSQVIHGSRNFFNLIKRIKNFSSKHVQEIALSVVQQNGYFAHPENVLIVILRDDNENVRNVGVAKVTVPRKQVAEESANNDNYSHLLNRSSIRLFDVPVLTLNLKQMFTTNLPMSILTSNNLQQLQA